MEQRSDTHDEPTSSSPRTRTSRRIIAGTVIAFAVAGLTTAGVLGIGALVRPATQEIGQHPEVSIKRSPADRINKCGGSLAEFAPDNQGLSLTVDFPESATLDDGSVRGTVTLTNTSDSALSGHLERDPTLVLSRDGVVLWYTNGGSITAEYTAPQPVEPGESIDYSTWFWPVTCSVDDATHHASGADSSLGFGKGLPRVSTGEYELSALFDFAGGGANDVLVGPTSTITLK